MKHIIVLLALTIAVADNSSQFWCTSNKNCTCRYEKEVVANCSGLHLTNEQIPSFREDVTYVDLSRNKITEVPQQLPSKMKNFDISDNNLEGILSKDFLKYPQLLNLNLNSCNLQFIEKGSLKKLNNLIYLSISDNKELSLSALPNISFDLQYSKLKTLRMNSVQCISGPTIMLSKRHIKYLQNMTLEELSLASNRIGILEVGLISMLPKTIQYIDVSDNDFSPDWYFLELGNFPSLITIKVGIDKKRKKFMIFQPCNDCKNESVVCTSHIQKRIHLTTNYKMLRANFTIRLPTKLQKIYAENLSERLSLNMENDLVVDPNNNISHLYFRDNHFNVLKNIKGLHKVKYIDISNNFCRYLSNSFFKEITQMQHLDLSYNLLANMLKNEDIFKQLKKLLYLDISNNFIYNLHWDTLRPLHNLQHLNLSFNKLQDLNANFINMTHLSMLDLSNNNIRFLGKVTIDSINTISEKQQVKINMLGNILSCACESLYFLQWMKASKAVIFIKRENYSCSFANGSISILNLSEVIEKLEIECTSFVAIISITTSLILVFTTITFSGIVYRYRWKMRYLYYVAKRNYGQESHSALAENKKLHRYHFDAFISYANEDRKIILPDLVEIEKSKNLKFCFHGRDFIPGTVIAENITNAIHNSRRTVCFLSKSYMTSEWCKYELNMARMESIYSRNGDSIIRLVLLDNEVIENIPAIFMDLIESETYLEYFGNEENVLFWRKLTEYLVSNV